MQNHEYATADSIFNQVSNSEKTNPIGPLLQATVYLIFAIDFHQKPHINKINSLLDKAEQRLEEFSGIINKSNEYYLRGIIKGIKAGMYYADGDLFLTFTTGLKAYRYFEEVNKINKENPESQIATGIFKFWKSRKTEFMKFMPFTTDDKAQGINQILAGISKKSYFRFFGIYSLSWILIDQKRFSEVIEILEKELSSFPENRFFILAIARAYQDLDIKKSVFYYKKLLNLIRRAGQNGYNEVVILHILAQIEFLLKNNIAAVNYLNEIDKVNLNNDIRSELNERFYRIKSLRDSISINK